VGLIAGQGTLPIIVARGMQGSGVEVHAVGLRDQYDAALPALCDCFRTAGVIQIGRWIRILRRAHVREAVMVGRVSKQRMHDPFRAIRQLPDWRAAVIWYRRLRHDRRDATVLAAVAEELDRNGITLIDSTTYIPDHLATPGPMGRVGANAEQTADIAFGWPLLRELTRLQVGQAIAVRERDVLAVEAVEGTDAMIDRAGALCRASGWTLIKTASPDHDMRADVPTIGVSTIERLAAGGAGCVAVGVGRVILVDKPAVLEAADKARIAIVGVE
jgi:DUF1009 family protein